MPGGGHDGSRLATAARHDVASERQARRTDRMGGCGPSLRSRIKEDLHRSDFTDLQNGEIGGRKKVYLIVLKVPLRTKREVGRRCLHQKGDLT